MWVCWLFLPPLHVFFPSFYPSFNSCFPLSFPPCFPHFLHHPYLCLWTQPCPYLCIIFLLSSISNTKYSSSPLNSHIWSVHSVLDPRKGFYFLPLVSVPPIDPESFAEVTNDEPPPSLWHPLCQCFANSLCQVYHGWNRCCQHTWNSHLFSGCLSLPYTYCRLNVTVIEQIVE